MAAFNFHRRKTRRWWYVGTTLVVAAFFAVFFVTSSAALSNSPSLFEVGDGNMTLDTSGNTDWNCFQNTTGFQSSANYGTTANPGTFAKADCKTTSGANNNSSPDPKFEQTPGQKFDTACPTFKAGNNPPKDVWSDVAQYLEASPLVNTDHGHDLYFYGASIRPVVNGNSSGNIYFSQGTNPNGANCRTVGDVLLTFDFLGGGSKPTLHVLTWQGPSGSCFVGSDSPTTGCWGPSNPETLTGGALSDGETNSDPIVGTDNALNGQNVLANGFSEIGINLTQAIKAAGGSATCFANETWVSRSSGSSFTSSPEMVVIDQQPTCGTINVIKHTLDGSGNRTGVNQDFGYTAGGLTPTTFTLNDANGATGDVLCTYNSSGTVTNAPCNKQRYSLVPPGTYTVTENAEPANFAAGTPALSCTVDSGSGTSQSVSGEQATITLGISGVVTCTYINQQQLGALRILKTSSKAAATPLSGAKFYVCTNSRPTTTNCTAPTPVGGSAISEPQSTNSNGVICIANLPFATYHVFESAAPSGYAIDDTSVSDLSVSKSGDCSSSTSASVSKTFTDTPLTDLSVEAKSQVTGGTQSTISCVDSGNNSVGTGGSKAEDSKWSDTGVKPDTYTCTIVVDP